MNRIILILFLISGMGLNAQSLEIVDLNESNYPFITAKFITFDENGFVVEPNISNTEIFENNVQLPIDELMPQSTQDLQTSHTVIAIDNSLSMNPLSRDLAIDFANLWIDNTIGEEFYTSLVSFNSTNFILQDRTTNKSLLRNSLNKIFYDGSSNYDAAIFRGAFGATSLLSETIENSKNLIIISNSFGDIDTAAVRLALSNTDIKLHTITIQNETKTDLLKFVQSTNGLNFQNIRNDNDIRNAVLTLQHYISAEDQNSAFSEITWKTLSCTEERSLQIFVNQFSETIQYKIENNQLKSIHYPDGNSLKFGVQNIGEAVFLPLEIIATKDNITINSISGSNSIFRITNTNFPLSIKKDSSAIINVEYEPTNENYIFNKFTINSTACVGNEFYVTGGNPPDNNSNLNNIEVVFPNGGERFITRADTTFEWTGVAESDTIRLELSLDNGRTWQTLNSKATNNKFHLKLPNIQSDSCLIRVKQESQEKSQSNVLKFLEHDLRINSLSWTSDSQYLSSGDPNSNYKWNANDGDVVSRRESTRQMFYSNMSPSGELLATSEETNPVRAFNLNASQAIPVINLITDTKVFLKLKWNFDNTLLAGYSRDGFIYIWNTISEQPLFTAKAHNDTINDMEWHPNLNRLATCSDDGTIKIWTVSNNITGDELFKSNDELNCLSWNPTGTNIAFGGKNNEVLIWNADTKNSLSNFSIGNKEIRELDWSKASSGRYIAVSTNDSLVYLWSNSLGEIEYIYDFHTNQVSEVKISPDGQKVASGDLNGDVHIWSISDLPFEFEVIQSDISNNTFSIRQPDISASNIMIAEFPINKTKDTLIFKYLRNNSNVPLKIDSIRIQDNTSNDIRIFTDKRNFYINPQDSLDLGLSIIGSEIGNFEATLEIFYYERVARRSIFYSIIENPIKLLDNYFNIGKVNLNTEKDSSLKAFVNISNRTINFNLTDEYLDTEQFDFSSSSEFSLQPGDTHSIDLSFNPQRLGRTSYSLEYNFDDLSSPIFVHFNAEGVAPEVEEIQTIMYEIAECSSIENDTTIFLRNIGSGSLNLFDFYLEDFTDNYIVDYPSSPINPNSAGQLHINFNSEEPGEFITNLVIRTNTQIGGSDSIIVPLAFEKKYVELASNIEIINFGNLEINEAAIDSFYVFNNGNVELNLSGSLNSEDFEILEIEKDILAPNDSSLIRVRFLGSNDFGTYESVIEFEDQCGEILPIKLTANIGLSEAEILTLSWIDFPTRECLGNSIDSTFYIYNTGTTRLTILDTYFENENPNFEILNSIIGSNILPEDSIQVNLRFLALENHNLSESLIIETNAINVTDGIHTISLTGNIQYTDFVISTDTLRYIDVVEELQEIKYFEIYNTGNLPISWEVPITTDNYVVENINPIETPINGSSLVTVRFLGGLENEEYINELILNNSCNSADTIYLFANVKGLADAGLRIGDAQGDPGDIVRIPISVYSPKGIEYPDVDFYETTLRFNKTLMVPSGNTPSGQIMGANRQINLTNIPGRPINEGDSILTYLEFQITLGDTNYSELLLSDSRVKDNNSLEVIDSDGELNVTGIRYTPDPRFINYTGEFFLGQNRPNAANETTTIDFSLIEEGYYKINIIDMTGKVVKEVANAYAFPGAYTITINIKDLPQGNYLYQLETESLKAFKKMTITR